jgi:hypothetical protein
MQTFLPYADFKESASVLDYRRLGKQRVENMQVLNILLNRTETKGWRSHPVTLMWSGYETALQEYQNAILSEWIDRGYRNNISFEEIDSPVVLPSWLGLSDFHISHQSNLLRKDYEYYSEFFDDVPHNLPYHWPVVASAS